MKLQHPFSISSRLLPCLIIGGASVQLEFSRRAGSDGRTRYRYTIDLPDGQSFGGDDFQSGCGGGGLQNGFGSLLSFLDACAESWRYAGKDGENSDLFPQAIAEWAAQNSDEIGMCRYEIGRCARHERGGVSGQRQVDSGCP